MGRLLPRAAGAVSWASCSESNAVCRLTPPPRSEAGRWGSENSAALHDHRPEQKRTDGARHAGPRSLEAYRTTLPPGKDRREPGEAQKRKDKSGYDRKDPEDLKDSRNTRRRCRQPQRDAERKPDARSHPHPGGGLPTTHKGPQRLGAREAERTDDQNCQAEPRHHEAHTQPLRCTPARLTYRRDSRYSFSATALFRRISVEPKSRVAVPRPMAWRSCATPSLFASSSAK